MRIAWAVQLAYKIKKESIIRAYLFVMVNLTGLILQKCLYSSSVPFYLKSLVPSIE